MLKVTVEASILLVPIPEPPTRFKVTSVVGKEAEVALITNPPPILKVFVPAAVLKVAPELLVKVPLTVKVLVLCASTEVLLVKAPA